MQFNRTLKSRQLHKNGEWTHNALYTSPKGSKIVLCVRIAGSSRWSCEVFKKKNGEMQLVGRFYLNTLTDKSVGISANAILRGESPKGITSRRVLKAA